MKMALALSLAVAGCHVQQPGYPSSYGYGHGAPGQVAVAAPAPARPRGERHVTFNRVALDDRGWQLIEVLEAHYRTALPDGNYWYDPVSGAVGVWGGPAAALLPPGMPLGGALTADASGGGSGRLTGVFINGRELHPQDVAFLQWMVGAVYPGRWWVDAAGNAGAEGGPPLVNLYVAARQRAAAAGGDRSWARGYGAGSNSFWVGGDGQGYTYASDGASGCSYASDGGGVIC